MKNILSQIKYSLMGIAVSLFAGLIFSGCGDFSLMPDTSPVVGPEDETQTASGPVVYGPGSYDSADTPILVKKDEEKKTLTFYNLDVGKNYTLEYDGTTCFYDKYGSALSLSQLGSGDIVDVKFIKGKKHLTEMKMSDTAWVIAETDRYAMDATKREVTIGDETYKISTDAVYFSDERQIGEQDIIPTDRLTFKGIDNRVYSIKVEKGHGYLRLSGHQGFIDGWIEIGNSVIQKVTEDMLITVPEGKYQVKISGSGTTAEKNVVINRNSESSLDFSDVEFSKPKMGTVLFSLNPSKAKLYIDGTQTDVSEAITLSYGLHQLICKAEGYTTITQYLNVGQPTAGIDITLEEVNEKKDDDSDKESESQGGSNTGSSEGTGTDSGNGSSGSGNNSDGSGDSGSVNNSGDNGNTANNGEGSGSGTGGNGSETTQNSNMGDDSGATTGEPVEVKPTYYQVYVDSPEGVEIYLDGSYVGIAPCSFKKVEGMHIITLSKSGYVTRSYTISVDSDDKDVSFSFADLVKEP